MQYKKILITGGAGFIGFHLAELLAQRKVEVVIVDNINNYYDPELKYGRLKRLGIEKTDASRWNEKIGSSKYNSLSFVRLNIEDREELPAIFESSRFDAVVNLAAQAGVRYSIENPAAYIDSNIVGFLNVLECCRNYSVKHLVYASSSSVYGENETVPFSEEDRVDYPVSLYAATKKSNELMAHTYSHLYSLATTGLRFFTVYGPWGRPDMAPILFATAILKNHPIKVFNNGEMSRDFTYIKDIIDGIIVSLSNPPTTNQQKTKFQIFNIGNGAPMSLMDFITTLEHSLEKQAEKLMLPMQPGDVPRTWANTSKLNLLGYKSNTGVKEGVSLFAEWFKNYYKL